MSIILAASMLLVQGIDGRMFYINPEQVVSIAPPKEGDELFAKGVKCVISLADRKFVSTRDSCDALQDRLRGTRK